MCIKLDLHHILVISILLLLMSYTSSRKKENDNFEECYNLAIEYTQNCNHHYPLYVTTMGLSSGLGSEFNYFLSKALLQAALRNKRLVYLKSGINWEYDCPEKGGWSCYLQFRCNDSVVGREEVDLYHLFQGHSLLQFHELYYVPMVPSICHEIPRVLLHYQNSSRIKSGYDCSTLCRGNHDEEFFETRYASIASSYLWHLNNKTKTSIHHINSVYGHLIDPSTRYVGMQIRLTDKHGEMKQSTWDWINNSTNLATTALLLLQESDTHQLFIATDDCTVIPKLVLNLQQMVTHSLSQQLSSSQKPIEIYSPCLDTKVLNHISISSNVPLVLRDESDKHGERYGGRNGGYESTLELIADLQMLRKSEVFAGLIDSNIVRMVHRMRPRGSRTYLLAAETYDNPEVRSFNQKRPYLLPWRD